MLSGIDFSTPIWLVNYYHILGTFSLVINSYVLFLVIFKSDKIDTFKYFLLTFQSSCFMVDIHLTFLMQPQPLYPIPAGFCTGLLAQNSFVSCQHLMTLMMALGTVQVSALTLCFFRKFIAMKKIERQELAPWKEVLTVVLMAILVPIVIFYFELCANSEEETFRIIMRDYPEYLESFKTLTNFAIYEFNIYWIIILLIVLFGALWYGSTVFYTTQRIYEILEKFKSSMSPVTYKKHKLAMMSLVAQLATSAIGLFPPFLICCVLIIEFEYAQVTGRFLLMIFSTHASINAIVLIVTTPPYRRFTVFWRNTKTTPLAVSTTKAKLVKPP